MIRRMPQRINLYRAPRLRTYPTDQEQLLAKFKEIDLDGSGRLSRSEVDILLGFLTIVIIYCFSSLCILMVRVLVLLGCVGGL